MNFKMLKISFRTGHQKARIFKVIDQVSDADKIKQGMDLARKAGAEMDKSSVKKEYLKMFSFHQLKLCKNVSILEPYDIPSWEQMMDSDQTFWSFLMNNQNQTMVTENPMLFDFKAPLELEIRLLRDSQM